MSHWRWRREQGARRLRPYSVLKPVGPLALKAMLADGGELALVDVREELIFSQSHLLLARSAPLRLALSAVLAFLVALGVAALWDDLVRFAFGTSFGVADPLLGRDVGFYVFRLPLLEHLGRRED